MKHAITLTEIYSDVLPEVPDALIKEIDRMLKKNRVSDPKMPIKINVSQINGLISEYLAKIKPFTGQNLLDATVLHYATTMQLWHENNILYFGPNFQNVGRQMLRWSSVQGSTAPSSRPIYSDRMIPEEEE